MTGRIIILKKAFFSPVERLKNDYNIITLF
nr:MAG TPA: hypothetical protein [Caudoviricetes sp.]